MGPFSWGYRGGRKFVIGMGKDDSIILFFSYNNFDCLYSYENNGENIFEINMLSCLSLFARKLNEIDLS